MRTNNNSRCLEEITMLGVVVTISRYVSDSQPGWVECKLVDAHWNELNYHRKGTNSHTGRSRRKQQLSSNRLHCLPGC